MANIDYASIVRENYEAFNAKDIERAAAVVLPDCRVTSVALGATLGFRDYFKNWMTAFPDAQVEIVSIVAQGDKVIAECIGRGTHKGVLSGPAGKIPPTNKRAELRFVDVFECRNGKIASSRNYFDILSFLGQLGVTFPIQPGKAPQVPEARH
jgi:steroid delta-isomerase-like uncharacterized protein